MKKNIELFVSKDTFGSYRIEEEIEDLHSNLYNLEYGDVIRGEYQVWEYPSGKIYDVISDRDALEDDDFSAPSSSKWLPQLRLINQDKELVSSSYSIFKSTSTKAPQ